ncbi:hypothetical protein [Kitasatospora sp. NPDC097643]|uniref:hypothetical protein n=1 Tax=Kitasatospora sp. NPDC097643 TaxID=3157230 RepID=UPI00331CDC84
MRTGWTVVGSIVLTVAIGAVLFANGFGPLALADRSGRLGTGEAKGRIDQALRATMDGVFPSLTYAGADFEVRREHDRWDGEPSMVSDVEEVVTVRTSISQTKLLTLMDQVSRAWTALGSRVVDRSEPADKHPYLRGVGQVGGETYLTFSAEATQDSTYLVTFRAGVGGVLYQPAHEYEPMSPLARTPFYAKVDPVDDPYWSH